MELQFYTTLSKAEELPADNTGAKRYLISGIASTTDPDIEGDVFSPEAIVQMAATCIGKPITTRHSTEKLETIGSVIAAKAVNNQLHIEAELDADDVLAERAYKKIVKLGGFQFSVYGPSVVHKFNKPGRRYLVKSCDVKHVAITSQAVNPNTSVQPHFLSLSLAKAMESIETSDVFVIEKSGEPLMDENKPTENQGVAPEVKVEVEPPVEPKAAPEAPAPAEPAKDAPEASKPTEDAPKPSKSEKQATVIAKAITEALKPVTDELAEVKALLSKSGAKWSVDDKTALKDLHDDPTATDNVKSKLRNLLGADAAAILDLKVETANPDMPNLVGFPMSKAVADEFASLKKSIADDFEAIRKAVAPQPKGVVDLVKSQSDLSSLSSTQLDDVLKKAIGG